MVAHVAATEGTCATTDGDDTNDYDLFSISAMPDLDAVTFE